MTDYFRWILEPYLRRALSLRRSTRGAVTDHPPSVVLSFLVSEPGRTVEHGWGAGEGAGGRGRGVDPFREGSGV